MYLRPFNAVILSGALAVLLTGHALAQRRATSSAPAEMTGFTYDHGGIVRGDTSKKQMALIFTGGDFGEGTPHILDVLKREGAKASFFFTGAFLRKPEHAGYFKRIVAEGHYLGPHSDGHLLYCPWEDREKTLVSKDAFAKDLVKNIADLKALGANYPPLPPLVKGGTRGPIYFIPPYEWFNRDQVAWTREMGVVLFNFTPGIGSNRDYVPEGQRRFAPSREIYNGILQFEAKDPHGLSGALLLLHVGADRKDKMYLLLEPLMRELKAKGYKFVRVDEMLGTSQQVKTKK